VNDAQMQALIIAELQATGADLTVLSGQMAVLWDLYAEKRYVAGRLQYLYTKRHAIGLLQGQHWQDVTVQDAGTSLNDSDLVKNLATIAEGVDAEIAALEKRALGARAGCVGAITATAPVSVTSGNDPNARQYRGDAIEGRLGAVQRS
jgi:hypothetical protein